MKKIDKLSSIYVIILNFQSFEDTIKYVNCLQNQVNIDLNILIVDNCSPNKSFNILKNKFLNSDNVEVIKSGRNDGYAYGNNFGLRYLEKRDIDFIIISNNDVEIVDTLLLSEMIQKYEKLENPAFISPLMLINNKISYFDSAWRLPTKTIEILRSTFSLSFLGYFYLKSQFYKLENENEKPIEVDCLPGSFFMGSQDVFKKINYFDEGTFLYLEETIIGEKVKELGLKNYLIKGLTYNHKSSKTIDQFNNQIQKFRILLKSKIHYWEKYKKANFLFIYLIKLLNKLREFELHVLKFLKNKKT